MARRRPDARPFGALLLLVLVASCDNRDLGAPQSVAPGVRYYHVADSTLLDGPGPVAIDLLRLDPGKVSLVSALALDEVMGREPVLETSRRHGALAAVNAGFFLPNGDPAGLLMIGHELVSEATRARGAIAIFDRLTPPRVDLLFDRVSVEAFLRIGEGVVTVPIGGVDTTRRRGELMLFTPRYHADTDTADRGTEWTLSGTPLTVVGRRDGTGRSVIPRDGIVLSYGGAPPPSPLDTLDAGATAAIEWRFRSRLGAPDAVWREARDIVGGAGLLVHGGLDIDDWTDEDLRDGFATERHPRTMVGVDDGGEIWLAAVDGRQPGHSVGMTFVELQRLAARLRLREALNLDGGGSTTMVVRDRIVNRPSDKEGARPVSDALLVLSRE